MTAITSSIGTSNAVCGTIFLRQIVIADVTEYRSCCASAVGKVTVFWVCHQPMFRIRRLLPKIRTIIALRTSPAKIAPTVIPAY
jgi:hypothetical protein